MLTASATPRTLPFSGIVFSSLFAPGGVVTLMLSGLIYLTGKFTVLAVTPPIESTRGWIPGGVSGGTTRLIW
jgi:hypothetical protein